MESRVLLTTIYVDANPAITSHTGTSWDTAFADLQQALVPAVSGDQIRVADGTYKPTDTADRTISFVLKNGVSILGGYAGYGAVNPDARDVAAYPTILNGNGNYHVVIGSGTDATAVLDGVTITGGIADGSAAPNYYGGGMYNVSGSPTINNCTFHANQAYRWYAAGAAGAGMYNDSSSPTLANCIFSDNLATTGGAFLDSEGGGIYNTSSSPTLTDCIFRNNGAITGGALVNTAASSPLLTDCVFTRNYSWGPGAMFCQSSSPTMIGCVFDGNTGNFNGAMHANSSTLILTNCTFAGNATGSSEYTWGGAINGEGCSVSLTNCTFAANTAAYGGAIRSYDSSFSISNCIFFGNIAQTGSQISGEGESTISVTYTDIQGGWTGIGNFDADPVFVRNPSPGADATWGTADDDYGDLRPQPTSPAIDAGSNSAVPAGVTTDLEGNQRIIDIPGINDPGAIVDMGAYERQLALTITGGTFLFDAPKPAVRFDLNNVLDTGSITTGDVVITPAGGGASVACVGWTHDRASRSVSFQLPTSMPDGNYQATLLAGSVSDTQGSTPSADGLVDFFILAGDANHNRSVDINDLAVLATNWQQTPRTFSQGDFNYDGIVDINDLATLATNWQASLPAPAAVFTAREVRLARKVRIAEDMLS